MVPSYFIRICLHDFKLYQIVLFIYFIEGLMLSGACSFTALSNIRNLFTCLCVLKGQYI